jgi:hypothetical protein
MNGNGTANTNRNACVITTFSAFGIFLCLSFLPATAFESKDLSKCADINPLFTRRFPIFLIIFYINIL